jgi:redox-sensitive bicupin YhaK (pirin superfamily)
MLQLRTWDTLGGGDRDWLKAKHHFAVDSQGNPAHMRLGNLVVWNDDEIAPRSGFPMHSHQDMEIVTYVREGVLHHEDNSGGRGEIRAGNVQAFSAGRGIRHSEFNGGDSPLRLFQIWLLPRRRGLEPRWATKSCADAQRAGRLAPLASGFLKMKLPCRSMPTRGYSARRSRKANMLHMTYRLRAMDISCPPVGESS